MCEGGVTCVREGLHVWGRGYMCEGGVTCVGEGLHV